MRSPCCDKQGTNRGAWSKEEDQKLIDYIRLHGEVSWRSVPKAAGLLRCGKSCRLRWINYLRPDVKRGNFEEDEEDLIIKLHALLGNRWSLIAGRLPGRTDNEIKNYWNSHLRKKLASMGIDPDNHRVTQNVTLHRSQSSNSATLSTTDDDVTNYDPKYSLMNQLQLQEEEEENSKINGGLPDLNLDLTISVPSALAEQKRSTGAEDLAKATQLDKSTAANPTTLLLFR